MKLSNQDWFAVLDVMMSDVPTFVGDVPELAYEWLSEVEYPLAESEDAWAGDALPLREAAQWIQDKGVSGSEVDAILTAYCAPR